MTPEEQPAQSTPPMPQTTPTQPSTPPAPRAEIQWDAGMKSIHPILDFDLERKISFVTLPLPLRDGESSGKTRQVKPYLIVCGPGFKHLVPLELANIPMDALEPVFLEASRWPQAHLKAFLDGNASAATADEVYTALVDVIGKYVDTVDVAHNKVLALFCMLTYVFPAFPSVPYIKIEGPRASGKTRLASILAMLCHNALHSSSLTPASIFRVTQGSRCTLIGDELENLAKNNHLSTLLNGGYKKGAVVVRAGAKGKLELFQSYGPKVIASIEPLNEVLASRTIMIRLTPTKDVAKARLNVTEFSEDWGRLRGMLYSWAMARFHDAASVVLPESAGISNRLAEIWAPLLQIAATLGPAKSGLMKELTDHAARTVAPAVPSVSLSTHERMVVSTLDGICRGVRQAELGAAEILAAIATQNPGAEIPTSNGLGVILRRLNLFTARRHRADGQRYEIDAARVQELAGAIR
jgi:hypothetical protein